MSTSLRLNDLTPAEKTQLRAGYEEALQYSIFYFREAIIPIALFAPLTTLYLTFILFSTPAQRKRFIYWCLIFAFLLNVVQTGAYIRFSVLAFHQEDGSIALRLANYLQLFVPWCFEVALTWKTFELYSFVIVCIPICFFALRASLFCAIIIFTQKGTMNVLNWLYFCEYTLQFCTTAYCSSLLVFKAFQMYRAQIRKDDTPKEQRMAYLRIMIESVFMTYALGVLINLALMIIWCLHIRYNTQKINNSMKWLILINTYGGLFLALLAAQWSTIRDIRSIYVTQQPHRNSSSNHQNHRQKTDTHNKPVPKTVEHQNDVTDEIIEANAIPSVSISGALATQISSRKRFWLGRPAIGPEHSALDWLIRPKEIKATNRFEKW